MQTDFKFCLILHDSSVT